MGKVDQVQASRAVLIEVMNVLGLYRDHLIASAFFMTRSLATVRPADRGRLCETGCSTGGEALEYYPVCKPCIWT